MKQAGVVVGEGIRQLPVVERDRKCGMLAQQRKGLLGGNPFQASAGVKSKPPGAMLPPHLMCSHVRCGQQRSATHGTLPRCVREAQLTGRDLNFLGTCQHESALGGRQQRAQRSQAFFCLSGKNGAKVSC